MLFHLPVAGVLGALLALSFLVGCQAPDPVTGVSAPSQSSQQVIDVMCTSDALLVPVVVPVILAAQPTAAPAAALDTVLVHPAVVAACAAYARRPAAITPPAAPGATVAPAVSLSPPVAPAAPALPAPSAPASPVRTS